MTFSRTTRNRMLMGFLLLVGIPALLLCYQNFTVVTDKEFDIRDIAPQKPDGYDPNEEYKFLMFRPTGGTTLESLENDWLDQHSRPYLESAEDRLNQKLHPKKASSSGVSNDFYDGQNKPKYFDFHFDTLNRLRMGDRDHLNLTCQATPQEVHFRMTQPIWSNGSFNVDHEAKTGLSTLNIGWSW